MGTAQEKSLLNHEKRGLDGCSGKEPDARSGRKQEETKVFHDDSGNDLPAHSLHLPDLPPDLRSIVQVWPTLSDEVKAKIIALVEGD